MFEVLHWNEKSLNNVSNYYNDNEKAQRLFNFPVHKLFNMLN